MPTLILPPRYTDDTQALWRAAIATGWRVERLASWRVAEELASEDVVLYGEPLFAAVVAQSLRLGLLEPPTDWVARLPERYRRRWVKAGTLNDARSITTAAFIKPANDKCFTAKVYPSGQELPGCEILDDATPVLIAEPVHWSVEYRCFVLDRRVRTFSPYLRDGELARNADGEWHAPTAEAQDASEFARSVLDDTGVRLPPSVVLDVGIIRDRGWAVVEANAAWGSGIYGCDPNEVLNVVQRSCVPQQHASNADNEWMSGN